MRSLYPHICATGQIQSDDLSKVTQLVSSVRTGTWAGFLMTNNTLSPKPKYTHKAPNLKTLYFNVVDCFARKEAETVYSLVYPSTRYLSPPALQKVQWLARNYLCLQDTSKRGSKQCQFMWEVSPKTTGHT